MKAVLFLLTGLFIVLYPFFVYWGLDNLSPRLLAAIILVAFAVRTVSMAGGFEKHKLIPFLPLFVAILISCTLVAMLNDGKYLLHVPWVIGLTFTWTFARTLLRPPTLIETFARVKFPVLPPPALHYCRGVTRLWTIALAANTLFCLYLALHADVRLWTLYNGFICYILFAIFFLAEYLVRLTQLHKFEAALEHMESSGTSS